MTRVAERQFRVSISGGDSISLSKIKNQVFQTKTGGDITAASTKNFDGGTLTPQVLMAPPEFSNVVITRAYDHDRDATMLANARQWVGSMHVFTVTIVDLNEDMGALKGGNRVYSGARLVGLTEPPVDSSSGSAAMFGMEFAVTSVAGS